MNVGQYVSKDIGEIVRENTTLEERGDVFMELGSGSNSTVLNMLNGHAKLTPKSLPVFLSVGRKALSNMKTKVKELNTQIALLESKAPEFLPKKEVA